MQGFMFHASHTQLPSTTLALCLLLAELLRNARGTLACRWHNACITSRPMAAHPFPQHWPYPAAGDLDQSINLYYITYTFSYIQEGMMAIAVYSTPSCSYCRMVKDWLKQRNVHFDDYNVASDQRRAEEMVRKSGQMGVPVTDINGRIIIGFNTAELERALK
jgi:glutaredoxin 3